MALAMDDALRNERKGRSQDLPPHPP